MFDLDASRAGISRSPRATVDSRDHANIDLDGVEATGEDVLGEADNAMAVLAPALRAGQAGLSQSF